MTNAYSPLPPGLTPPGPELFRLFAARYPLWSFGSEEPCIMKGHLGPLGTLAESSGHAACMLPAYALWCWQRRPFDPVFAARTLASGALPADGRRLARLMAETSGGVGVADIEEAWKSGATETVLEFLRSRLDEPDGPRWLACSWEKLLLFGERDLAPGFLGQCAFSAETMPLRERLLAEWAFHYESPDTALAAVRGLDASVWGLWRAYVEAELLLRAGEREAGTAALFALWRSIPWHVNVGLKLYDLLFPLPEDPRLPESEDVSVLLYSWNKADLLAQTLASLAESNIGRAHVTVLDNGSTDHMPEVIANARRRFGEERFQGVRLPVNIGAPGARSWLLSLPQVRASRWVAFLDDDALMPANWLARLLSAARARPNTGAVGCRITSVTTPYGLQSADYNMNHPRLGEEMRINIFDNCAGQADTGLYAYSRPCLSVSGCCHLLSREALDTAGGFDIRFSPTQFDDLDRDLRSHLAGFSSFYAGDLAIRHVQHSSLTKASSPAAKGNVAGNRIKLEAKYTDEELRNIFRENLNLLWADYSEKIHRLCEFQP